MGPRETRSIASLAGETGYRREMRNLEGILQSALRKIVQRQAMAAHYKQLQELPLYVVKR